MGFKENLLAKIRIDRLAERVLATLGPPGGDAKLDKGAMRELLGLSPYVYRRERDLDLYIREAGAPPPKILVLDNELPIYRTTAADVAMRKSPEVGEMVNIRNIVKILRDSDVKVSRKADSLRDVQAECIAAIDLSFSADDINDIRRDGIASLESRYPEGVDECLALFAELLGFREPPRLFRVPHCSLFGAVFTRATGEEVLGPAVIFNRMHHALRLTEEHFGSLDKEALPRLHRIASGQEKTGLEGAAVFARLQQMVLSSRAGGN
ncbi:MAG: hypothetical protein MUD16_12070 [Desulfobacterales bacterium]|jgi:hypothetical protein|nr:hypothetical protein [Desulfobacterales bacterium]